MSTKYTGGPAFPGGRRVEDDSERKGYFDEAPAQKGMSLRDWFAGQALVGMLSTSEPLGDLAAGTVLQKTPAIVAAFAYQYADACLIEREK